MSCHFKAEYVTQLLRGWLSYPDVTLSMICFLISFCCTVLICTSVPLYLAANSRGVLDNLSAISLILRFATSPLDISSLSSSERHIPPSASQLVVTFRRFRCRDAVKSPPVAFVHSHSGNQNLSGMIFAFFTRGKGIFYCKRAGSP